MNSEDDKHINNELKRLRKLRMLVISEIDKSKTSDDTVDMTIIELEEWLQEINDEIEKLTLKK
ncbi:MAG: hypothetical protein V1904_06365 [Bacteroidota bacterium]